MKKIIGSPIGLGEVNLTVDNRVRRCIKEYFGDVDNNSFEVEFVPGKTEEGKREIKIRIDAPEETHLRKIFLLILILLL